MTNVVDAVGIVFNVDAVNGQILVRATSSLFNRETGTNQAVWNGTVVDVLTGFRIGGAAASGSVLTGNGTNFVALAPSGTGVSGYWTRTGTYLYNTNQGDNVGIGTTNPVKLAELSAPYKLNAS